jgi:tRNA1Val (adenine37-N6)-methyltransferase
MRNELLKPEERLDDLQRSNLKIIQNPDLFCFGMDAVLLSGFVTVKAGDEVTDLCTGTGIIPLLLSAKTKGKHFTGIEIQTRMADMAERSVKLNSLENKIRIVCGDIRNADDLPEKESQDTVTCNPLYMAGKRGIRNPDETKAVARHEIKCTMSDAVKAGACLLKPGGRYAVVHRPNRLIELIGILKENGLEPKRIRFVHPFADREANMVLLEAVKGGGSFLITEPPVIVFEAPGKYTREIREVYGY